MNTLINPPAPQRPQPDTPELLSTGIRSLDELLIAGGLRYFGDQGLFGVLFGAAGTGKSILALQICCGFSWGPKSPQDRCAIYISQEPPKVIGARIQEFGYFHPGRADLHDRLHVEKLPNRSGDEKPLAAEDNVNWFERGSPWAAGMFKEPRLYIFHMPLNTHQQTDKLVNIFDVLTHRLTDYRKTNRKKNSPKQPLLICIDNAEAVCREAYLETFGKPTLCKEGMAAPLQQDRSFYKLLRTHLAESGINSLFVFEEPDVSEETVETLSVATTTQAYAADLVVHLDTRIHPNGYRERMLEILKAKNQFHRRGKHHFSIVPPERGDERGVGIVIYPSLATQLHQMRFGHKGVAEPALSGPQPCTRGGGPLGIVSLDEQFKESLDLAGEDVLIPAGSSSVLVSDLDQKATEIALHFALANRASASGSLYVSFQHSLADLLSAGKRFQELGSLSTRLGDAPPTECLVAYMRPEQISEGKLFQDLMLLTKGRDRVVVDNIFAFAATFPLVSNVEHLLAALLAMFKEQGITSLVVDMVEVGEGRNPIEKSTVAGLADNVFLLRHLEFYSRPRSVFSALKLRGRQTSEKIWELEEKSKQVSGDTKTESRLEASDTFGFYQDVLTGRPTPVRISMGLFRDSPGSPLHQYLEAQQKALQQTLGEAITIKLYGPEEYARMQRTVRISQGRPFADCQIVAIDEFWLEDLIRNDLLQDLDAHWKKENPDLGQHPREQYITAAHDIAIWRQHKDGPLRQDLFNRQYAVPVRHNCGIFCCIPAKVEEFLTEADRTSGGAIAGDVEAWRTSHSDPRAQNPFTWQRLLELRQLWEAWLARPEGPSEPQVFFTFCMDLMESCVSFLLELACSTLENREELFQEKLGHDGSRVLQFDRFQKALETLLGLLGPDDLQRLADGCFRSSEEEPRALFSRQWMSTLGCLRAHEQAELQRPRYTQDRVRRRAASSLAPETKSTASSGSPDEREQRLLGQRWSLRLEPLELPIARDAANGRQGNTRATPVSGPWYLGILKGSVAVGAGVRVIGQFCSVLDDEQKLRHYIGLPVRRMFYLSEQGGTPPFHLPYADNFARLAEIQREIVRDGNITEDYRNEVLQGYCPFYRMRIENYDLVAPILWRMLVETAKGVVSAAAGEAIPPERVATLVRTSIEQAKSQYRTLEPAYRT